MTIAENDGQDCGRKLSEEDKVRFVERIRQARLAFERGELPAYWYAETRARRTEIVNDPTLTPEKRQRILGIHDAYVAFEIGLVTPQCPLRRACPRAGAQYVPPEP